MARLRTPDDTPSEATTQSFRVQRPPHDALDAAEVYLEGAGIVSPRLRGRMQRTGDELVVHHGRIRTRIGLAEQPTHSDVRVTRHGRAPLEDTRSWLFGIGLGGFVLAWALAWYNSRGERALAPLVTITLFLLGLVAVIVVLYVVDRSLERRSASLCRSLEDAMKGDPVLVLQREVDALERSSAVANAILFYCAALVVEFLVFVILLSDGVRQGIDEAVTLDVMRAGFGLPVLPAVVFGLVWFTMQNRMHRTRLALVERRLKDRSARPAGQ